MWASKVRQGSVLLKGHMKHASRIARRQRRYNAVHKARLLSIESVVESLTARISNYHQPVAVGNIDPNCIDAYDFHNQVEAINITRREIVMEALLSNPKVRMRDPAIVEHKLNLLIDGGTTNLIVISDFDYTLSRFHDGAGEKCWTTHGVFDAASALVSADLGNKVASLKAKYLPIEFDPNMSIAEKTPHMVNWWKTAHKHIVDSKFTKDAIEKFVQSSKIELRDKADEFITELNQEQVPLIIFSAGIGNVIDMFMRRKFGSIPRNVHIISNMMDFDEGGVVRGFKEPLIHTFCKNGSVIRRKRSFTKEAVQRSNVLLMGDSLGDLNMDVGVENERAALKIGFLNFNTDALMDKFLDGYDIVLIDDQTVDIPSNILDAVQHADAQRAHNNAYNIDRTIGSTSSCRIEAAEETSQVQRVEAKSSPVATDAKA